MTAAWLGSSRYAATISCLTHDTVIASLYIIADVIVATSILACAAKMFVSRHRGFYLLPYQCRLTALLGVTLSLGYVIDALVLFDGAYRLEVVVRGATAGIASVLAFSLWVRERN
jgi:hypothetical protein